MGGGNGFDGHQSAEIDRLLRTARQDTGLHFSVWVGRAPENGRSYPRRLHAAIGPEAPISVLIAVDPVARRLEIVTGCAARRRLDDGACARAAMSMTSVFSAGDLAGGIKSGIGMLADHVRAGSR